MYAGNVIRLGGEKYEILESMGYGYLAQVYKAKVLPGQELVAIKILKTEHCGDSKALAQFEEESKVLLALAEAEKSTGTHYAIRLRSAGQDQEGRYYQVQEFAPGVPLDLCLGELSEDMELEIATQFAHLLQIAHGVNVALPDMKIDEVLWDGTSICVVDWNLTRQGVEEQLKDLRRFGALLFHLFTERPLILTSDLQVKGELGDGVPRWSQLSEGTRLIISRALHREPKKCYRSAKELREDLEWQRENLRLTREGQWRALEERTRIACLGSRWERALATCLAALNANPDEKGRSQLERLKDQIKRELDKEIMVPLARGLSNLKAGLYQASINDFEEALRRDPANREARYQWARAKIGLRLETDQYFRFDPTGQAQRERVHQCLAQIVQALMQKQHEVAEEKLRLIRSFPEPAHSVLTSLEGMQLLDGAVRAGKLVEHAEETLKDKDFDEAERLLRDAITIASEEKHILRLLRQVEADKHRLAEKTKLLERAQRAQKSGNRDEAIRLYEEVLELDPNQELHEALSLLRREKQEEERVAQARALEREKKWQRSFEAVSRLLDQGSFEEAYKKLLEDLSGNESH